MMKKIVGIVLLVPFVGVIGYRVLTHGEEPAVKDIEAYQEELGIPVEIETVQRGNLTISRHFTGTIEGEQQADAIAKTTQKIISIPVKVGDDVKQGQIVAELDFDIASALSLRYQQSKASFEDAKRDYQRMKSLFEAGAVSEQALDKAKMALEIATRNFEAARKLVRIEAPISGTVTHIYYKAGETVSTGRPVVRIAKLNQVLIEIDINETEIAGIKNGQEALVSVPAYPDKTFRGKLQELSLSADPFTRSFKAWVRLQNPQQRLRPGMFAKVAVRVTSKKDVLTISKDAIIEKNGKKMVYVVTRDQVAELREIQSGQTSANRVEVLSGLNENDRVVVLGHNKLQPGGKVNIVKSDV
ncbi:MAG: efflux RND transporter periplasmic adaptor subunit [bacterium]